jgi:glycine/D-amino acid oxidase-like deaminating enzyme
VDRLTQDDRSVTLCVQKGNSEHTYPTARHVVLACGSWALELAPWAPVVKRQGGWAFTWQASRPGPGSISVWAPYKQVVAFEREDGEVWAGDGSALKPESMAEARMQLSLDRCCEVAFPGRRGHGLRSLASVHAGYRPYAERSPGQPCVLETRGRVTVATGGAKNGTMAAGWCAHRLREELSWR